MKRIASILLLTLLLFNWFGYRFLLSFLEDKANTQLESRLDDHQYDDSQLVSLKIPLRYVSYYNSSTRFERVDGQIEINGLQYKYVKRRIYRDSLEMLCIPNHAAMALKTTQNEFFRFSNDLQQQGKKPASHTATTGHFQPDVYTTPDPFQLGDHSVGALPVAPYYAAHITSCYTPTAEHPPDIG